MAKYLGRTDTRTRPVDVVGSKSAVKPIHFGPGVGSNKQLIAAEPTSELADRRRAGANLKDTLGKIETNRSGFTKQVGPALSLESVQLNYS